MNPIVYIPMLVAALGFLLIFVPLIFWFVVAGGLILIIWREIYFCITARKPEKKDDAAE